jgi:hypothetical protein
MYVDQCRCEKRSMQWKGKHAVEEEEYAVEEEEYAVEEEEHVV